MDGLGTGGGVRRRSGSLCCVDRGTGFRFVSFAGNDGHGVGGIRGGGVRGNVLRGGEISLPEQIVRNRQDADEDKEGHGTPGSRNRAVPRVSRIGMYGSQDVDDLLCCIEYECHYREWKRRKKIIAQALRVLNSVSHTRGRKNLISEVRNLVQIIDDERSFFQEIAAELQRLIESGDLPDLESFFARRFTASFRSACGRMGKTRRLLARAVGQ